ncbi:mycofactocin biosynthesis glycosyltransferase MftF [Streptomyces sp. MS06]|uniref:mycofactocin biosynthesis glycosyltransferase MftF n=1 Tax=Streptomyces sp. MS06 TaxID=3385974 RepID=UPI0039A38EB1
MTLPHGFVVTLDRTTRVLDSGRTLLGGHPTRLLRLGPRAVPLLTGRTLRVRCAAGAVLAERLLDTGLAQPSVRDLPPLPGPGGSGPACSYVVPVRDRPYELDRLLASIRPPAGTPVIVVDDASRSPGPVAAVAARHEARLIALTTNLGPAGARNAGLREVATPYVAFVDSDVVLAPGTVPTLLRHFTDPEVALAAPRITALATADSGRWLGRYESVRSSLDLGGHPAAVRPGTPVSWVPGACVVARTDVLRSLGGFDAGMRVGEDVDLCWRVVRAGHRVRYEPAAQAAHEHRVNHVDWFRRKAFYGTGAHPLAERHPEHMAPAVLAPWCAALLLALLAQRRWSLPVAGSIAIGVTARNVEKLKGVERPVRHAVRLTGLGTLAALGQGAALLTRHWWPLTAVGCLASRRVRRAAAVAAVTDVALELPGRRYAAARPRPVAYGIARRLDDLAYGSGVWISALRGRSTAALRPRVAYRNGVRRLLPRRRGPRRLRRGAA